jgi:acetolactate synthase I/II/III large subunit
MMKLSDYVANFLVGRGIQHVFMLTGGGAMHLNNSLGKHPDLKVVFNHHEQASAMAAESYARLTGKIAVVNVTTGPGGINTLNGVFGAWTDSIPMLIISGQVRYDTTVHSTKLKLRQLGDQECEIIKMVKPITKYAVMVTKPETIKMHLQKALEIATTGRPGPVWIDIPMNVQGAQIDINKMRSYKPSIQNSNATTIPLHNIEHVLNKIRSAKRPVLLVGSGIRLSGSQASFLQLVELLKIPVVTAWNAHDVIHDDHPFYFGRPGTIGDRPGNFIVQNSDLLLVLGSRLNIRQIGYDWKSFARGAYKIVIDIDPEELKKPTLSIDYPICGDAKGFINQAISLLRLQELPLNISWLNWCAEKKKKYPVVLASYWNCGKNINPYCFMQTLSKHLINNQIIVTGDGTACVVSFQTMQLKEGQRLYTNSGSASMGYDLPAAIGACVGSGNKKIICLAGDGSIQQNIQELATIAYHRYPIKIFVLNNNGYHSIRQTQINYFGEPLVGVGPESGLGFPEMQELASAYGISYSQCNNHQEMDDMIIGALKDDVPHICEIMLNLEQAFAPKMSSKQLANGQMVSRPLEDLAPFLSREELKENMLIDLLPASIE